jgi:hypothetical protein
LKPGKRLALGVPMLAPHSPSHANAARPGKVGGAAETIRRFKLNDSNRSGRGFQDYTSWLSQKCFWRDSLAARIADARSRVTIGLHLNELNSIKDEVAAFRAHCAQRPTFGGGA